MNSQNRVLVQHRSTLESMRLERERLNAQKQLSRLRMNKSVQTLFKRPKRTTDRISLFMNLAQNALAIYQGIRMGSSFISAIRKSFGRK